MAEKYFADFADSPSTKTLTAAPSHRALDTVQEFLRPSEGTSLSCFVHIMHRLIVFAIAVWYVEISLHSFATAYQILQGSVSHNLPIQIHTANLMAGYAGVTTIQESPLVQQVLDGKTKLRNDTLYLETPWVQSTTGCSNVPNFNVEIYSNEFLRFIFSRLQTHASYNLSYVKDLELIAPIVDCTFDILASGDQTRARTYYLTRQRSDLKRVLLLSTSLSVQDYSVGQQFQRGPALVLLVTAIEDMSVSKMNYEIAIALNYPYVAEPVFEYSELKGIDGDNNWLLETLPNQMNLDPVKAVRVVRRFGRYLSDPTAQSNIEMAHWGLSNDPASELSEWRWQGRTVLHDSWAWAHAVHGVYAVNVFFNLSVLGLVMYRRLRMGHIWVGDAFSTISKMLLYRGVLVLVCNQLNGFWTITKMCISLGDSVAGLPTIYYKPELVQADLLAIYFNLVSVLSYLARERLDPILAFGTFELGWVFRLELAKMFPSLRRNIESFARADAIAGLLDVSPGLAGLSPMKLSTAYGIEANRKPVLFSIVFSIFSPMIFIIVYIAARKMARFVNFSDSGSIRIGRRRSSVYRKELQQVSHTSFEVATGAALTTRFGVISGYSNYVVRDSRQFATIDAVYGNGFLVANGKFLVGAQDLLPLILMKLTRIRFTNIFVYEIMKDSVKETARLVYPTTLSWSDLWHLDASMLA